MISVAYILLLTLYLLFVFDPKKAVYFAFFIKPVIDMFWWAKNSGVLVVPWLSPLYVTGVTVPLIALIMCRRVNPRKHPIPEDKVIIFYAFSMVLLGVLKIATQERYLFNALELTAKTVIPVAFYWVGKNYFTSTRDYKILFYVLVLRALFPFALTFGQFATMSELKTFDEAFAEAGPDAKANEISGFYLGARHGVQRISGAYEGVYELGYLGMFTTLLCFMFLHSKENRFSVRWLALLLTGLYYLYFTYSRTVWCMAFVSLTLFLTMRKDYKRIAWILVGLVILFVSSPIARFRFEDEVGFLTGEVEFGKFGYGRGNLWTDIWERIHSRDLILVLTGGFGVGNPENQFLSMLAFNGYLGLGIFVITLLYLSIKFLSGIMVFRKKGTLENNVLLILSCISFCSYWIAGLGNTFYVQISEQWIIWLTTGVVMGKLHSRKRVYKVYTGSRIEELGKFKPKLSTT